MIVKEVKQIVADMELSSEARAKINSILDGKDEGMEIENEILDKILAIVDIEIDANKLAADIYQASVDVADTFLKEVDAGVDEIADEVDEIAGK